MLNQGLLHSHISIAYRLQKWAMMSLLNHTLTQKLQEQPLWQSWGLRVLLQQSLLSAP